MLPTLGNNDTKYHYQPAFGSNKEDFYEFFDSAWFLNHSGTKEKFSNEDLKNIKSSIKSGGWYRADLVPGKLSLLAIDSLPFNTQNKQDVIAE